MKAIGSTARVEQIPTHIAGFDALAVGGLPLHRTALVMGTAGSGKTVFAAQFLVEGVRQSNEPGVFVTLEESPQDIRHNMLSLGWDIVAMEADAQWAFVDGSASLGDEDVLIGEYDLGGLLSRIQGAVARIGAKRVVVDAIGALAIRMGNVGRIRTELFRISRALNNMLVTSIMTSEQSSDYGEVGRSEAEEFVVDSVIVLRNALEVELRRRTLEILKMRGEPHRRGEFPFVITNGKGVEVVPLSAIALEHKSSLVRVTFGNAGLDSMCGGGPFRDSTILVSGPTGAGKTLMATEFTVGGTSMGEHSLFLGFEESRDQILRNAAGWGHDFARMEDDGLLRVICEYPESMNLEERLVYIKSVIEEFRPRRVALDSLGALGRLASNKSLRDFVLGLTAFVKQHQITTLFTTTVSQVMGAETVTERQFTEFTDSILLLRYVEVGAVMLHGLMVLKMRGSRHDTSIRNFTIDDQGMHIGAPFRQPGDLLAGGGKPHGSAKRTGGRHTRNKVGR
ncbi:circadian clock protein KaiC [Pseudoduganella namucuonensis]|uniref:non-specific serine/threonine protein kinase n=1 Tax=Pseudoduganella namucuonensis TaxID=1035707 RepID=A0A1I7LTQ8_9BURK|nr:circadian clock protein KaiC [Pseudoduganella namucuonensis]SFV13073.1 circadian clock protein KaiC [Pseudoduganella namucuonensis]